MMKSIFTLLYASLLCVLMAGCTHTVKDKDLVHASYGAADGLLNGVEDKFFRKQPILVASFVNVDNLQQSSTFGRMIAEQISSRLAQHNYKVIEMKLRTDSVFVRAQTGEFLLSREVYEISSKHDAYSVVVGTYGASKETVYVTAKLLRVRDGIILSSYDYSLPLGPDTKKMLRKGR
ncbi:FlgO family outer membrane protein [Candidatus Parabeggiatoa sp. HSG14]|uniref:FlgO family outer membrane protein n=1 Tax=Candidatus Parabeggiatoa sp. HSG14 TaxID=3055593 RepID=UPI0025A893C5|nr:FlgO family outer membrane protein [Thiotrichales bacterium HSG14]